MHATRDPAFPRPGAAIRRAYHGTTYELSGPPVRLVRIGPTPAALARWLAGEGARRAVLLTAWNPLSEKTPKRANEAANRRLERWLDGRGLRHAPSGSRDSDGWAGEPGFCVFDPSDADVNAALREFRQHAAVDIRPARVTLRWHPQLRRSARRADRDA